MTSGQNVCPVYLALYKGNGNCMSYTIMTNCIYMDLNNHPPTLSFSTKMLSAFIIAHLPLLLHNTTYQVRPVMYTFSLFREV